MPARFLLCLLSGSFAFAGCLPVTGSRILARDLALADPQFSAIPSTLVVGFAPAPGIKRIYPAAELERIARANGVSVRDPADICFELPMRPIEEQDVAAAMRRSLPAGAELKIVELQKNPAPAGQVEFSMDGLEPATPTSAGTQLWRGNVRYAETLKAPVWARVLITARVTTVVAATDLPANSVVDASSLRVETRIGPIEREKTASRIEDVSGRMLTRALKAGTPVPVALLAEVPAVRRGDQVEVEVQCGRAHLRFEAVAESAGSEGDTVELRNPISGKTFRARIAPGGRVVLNIGAGQKL